MKPNLNSKGGQGHNEGPNKSLNQILQGDSEKIGYMSSNRSLGNYYRVLDKCLIRHVLRGQKGGSTNFLG